MITIFVSKTSNSLNRKPYDIENITENICLNPMYKSLSLCRTSNILMDSGAFQNEDKRVTYEESLERQLKFGMNVGQSLKYIVAYDKIDDVNETIKANYFLLQSEIPNACIPVLVTQGKNEIEYLDCLQKNLVFSESYNFTLGFGGIAKSGINKKIENKLFYAIENIKNDFKNIKHIHLFGVFTNKILIRMKNSIPENISLSCDTASIEIRSVMGNVFDNGKWVKIFSRSQKYIDYDPNILAKENVTRAVDYYKKI